MSKIIPDKEMIRDEQGQPVEIIIDPISVINRMNPGQLIEQLLNRGSEIVRKRVADMVAGIPKGQPAWEQAYNLVIDWLSDVHKNWGDLVHSDNQRNKIAFVEEVIRDGIYLQITPFLKGLDQNHLARLIEKYGITKSHLSWPVTDAQGNTKMVTTKQKVMVGSEYFYLLYKTPHIRCPGIGYVSQYRTPIRVSPSAKYSHPFSQTPLKLGEDEIRNIVATSGAETAAHILGVYANNYHAVESLANHLLFDQRPSQLNKIETPLDEIVDANAIVNVTRHIFACMGIDIAPTPESISKLIEYQREIKGLAIDVDKNLKEEPDDDDQTLVY